MSKPTRAAPIGRTWTRVLHLLAPVGEGHRFLTTAQVTAAIWGEHLPEAKLRSMGSGLLGSMRKRGYVARASEWFWTIDELGCQVLAGIRARPRRRVYRTHWTRRTKAKNRRDDLAARGLCINGAKHGPATHGQLCSPCRDTHKESS
jgi:hypothetical protein